MGYTKIPDAMTLDGPGGDYTVVPSAMTLDGPGGDYNTVPGENSEPTLPDYGSWQLVLEGDTGTTTRDDGGTEYLSAIQDNYTGNGHVYDNADENEQPQFSGVTLNGVQGIGHWNNAHRLEQSAGSAIAETTYTLVMVSDFQDVSDTQYLLDFLNGRLIFEIITGTMGVYDGAHRDSGLVAATGPAVHVWHIDGANSFCESDGTASSAYTVTGVNVTAETMLGARFGSAMVNPARDMELYGLYLSAPRLSAANLADLKANYLTPKWGV